MTNSAFSNDERGIVYLEFLFAFVPIFVLFLGICQLALIAAARVVTKHAAVVGARSAIVVLEASPNDFDGAPRGNLTQGSSAGRSLSDVVRGAKGLFKGLESAGTSLTAGFREDSASKNKDGARMAAIRAAASFPLLALAPRPEALAKGPSLASSARGAAGDPEGAGVDYTNAATSVTIHLGQGSDAPTTSSIPPEGDVTVRVGYLFPCAVPIARVLLCSRFEDAKETRFTPVDGTKAEETVELRNAWTGAPGRMKELAPNMRFAPLLAQATLPNQGLGFATDGDSPP